MMVLIEIPTHEANDELGKPDSIMPLARLLISFWNGIGFVEVMKPCDNTCF